MASSRNDFDSSITHNSLSTLINGQYWSTLNWDGSNVCPPKHQQLGSSLRSAAQSLASRMQTRTSALGSNQKVLRHRSIDSENNAGTITFDGSSTRFCSLEGEYCFRVNSLFTSRKISSSSFSTVHKPGQRNKLYALKCFPRISRDHPHVETFLEAIATDFAIAASLSHPNIVRTFRLCALPSRFYMAMEHCAGGTLRRLIQKQKPGIGDKLCLSKTPKMRVGDKLCLFKQLLRGVAHLHRHGVVHNNINPETLLLTDTGRLKICDFGCAQRFDDEGPAAASTTDRRRAGWSAYTLTDASRLGEREYSSPEAWTRGTAYGAAAADIWACGIVLFAMLADGRVPWRCAAVGDADYRRFCDAWGRHLTGPRNGAARPAPLPKKCGRVFEELPISEKGKSTLLRMLDPEWRSRIDIEELMSSEWVSNTECCQGEGSEERRQDWDETEDDREMEEKKEKGEDSDWSRRSGSVQVAEQASRRSSAATQVLQWSEEIPLVRMKCTTQWHRH